jgi:chemotaxis protein methyltransferase CheR
MIAPPSMELVSRFRDMIATRLGLNIDESKLGNLAKLLAARCGGDCAAYLGALATAPLEQLAALAPDLTVTETYFFRNVDQIDAFAEVALPHYLQAGEGGAPVRVLSAGCASGEEPYSLAIAARERAGVAAGRITFTALDINPAMLAKAARARYTQWSLREFPAALKGRWFRADGDGFELDPSIRRMVAFEARNLADPDPQFWRPGSFEIVFCRNVLMYFTPGQMQAAVERIACALVPGGYLFLGHAETLRGLTSDFHLCHTHGTFYYQRKPQLSAPQPHAPFTFPAPHWHAMPQLNDTAWVDAIGRAAQRINVLAEAAAPAAASAAGPRTPDLERARAYLHSERYAQTLEQIGGLAHEHAGDPDVLLLKAVSLSQSGALEQAEATCRQLLALDELNAGAHYVLALCREEAGDVAGALGHNQSAAYLAPDFAMPRLHIGLLARRHGDRDAARHDLAQAMVLLQKEDAARLLLFGGGFKREALVALCRAELAALGECT